MLTILSVDPCRSCRLLQLRVASTSRGIVAARILPRRDAARADKALTALEQAARGTGNLMPPILDCMRAYCTAGEICNCPRAGFCAPHEASVV